MLGGVEMKETIGLARGSIIELVKNDSVILLKIISKSDNVHLGVIDSIEDLNYFIGWLSSRLKIEWLNPITSLKKLQQEDTK